jgi:hypothetical protein
MTDSELLREIVGAFDVLGMALLPDTDEEAAALHALADRGLCEHTSAGFVPTDAGRYELGVYEGRQPPPGT